MKKITLEKVYRSLKEGVYRVKLSEEVAFRVRKAVENTFTVLGAEPHGRGSSLQKASELLRRRHAFLGYNNKHIDVQ